MIKVDDCSRCSRELPVRYIQDGLCSRCRRGKRRTNGASKAQRAAVARDKKCVRCNSTDRLHGHHVVPISQDGSLAEAMWNIVTLCAHCHAREHPEFKFIG